MSLSFDLLFSYENMHDDNLNNYQIVKIIQKVTQKLNRYLDHLATTTRAEGAPPSSPLRHRAR
jgi:hypothetical protein